MLLKTAPRSPPQVLLEKNIISKCPYGIKVIGNGTLSKQLTVKAAAYSASAKEKIEALGGKPRWSKCCKRCATPGRFPSCARRSSSRCSWSSFTGWAARFPVPFINTDLLNAMFDQSMNTTVLGLYNAMSGGALASANVFALSIQPYINSSIILQLLCVAIPALERLQKEGGEEGRKKIAASPATPPWVWVY